MVIPPEHVDFFFGAFPKLDSIEMVLNGVEVLNPRGNLLDRQQKLGLMWNQKQLIKDIQK